MSGRHTRAAALFLGLALALTASPAAASTEQFVDSATATPVAETAQLTQQQATPKRLRLTELGRFGDGSNGPVRPGDEFSFGLSVLNDGERAQEFVLTFTLPPELTLVSLRSPNSTATCSGNVCRGTIAPGASVENQIFASVEGRARLSSSFRGTTTTIRADLQEDANPDPRERTRTVTVLVAQPASGQSAADASASGTGTGLTTLPRTGDGTTVLALLALCLLLLGAIAQLLGTRRSEALSR